MPWAQHTRPAQVSASYLSDGTLAGRSGTGKSSLPRLYAAALGHTDEYLHVPVRPDWLDDRDFLGAFNPLHRRYEPAANGVCDRLITSQRDYERDRGGVYLICLDEMNLSRVEHYFAQSLSLLELGEEDRTLTLFAESVASPNDVFRQFRRLRLNPGLRFVGTVNVDETTHFLSPKVLDRSSIVSFATPSLETVSGPSPGPLRTSARSVHLRLWQSWGRVKEARPEWRALLGQVDEPLRRSRQGIGLRRFRRALHYLGAAQGLLAEDRAIDLAVAQIILPTLRKTAYRFDETLKDPRDRLPGRRFPRTARLLEALSDSGYEDDFFQLL